MSLDDDQFALIYKEHYRNVVAFVRARGHTLDVEDVVGDVFEAVYKRRRDIPVGKELPWIYSTAARVIANKRRQRARLDELLRALIARVGTDVRVENPDHAQVTVDRLTFEQVLGTLKKPVDKSILFLAAHHDYTAAEIGEIVGLSRTAVTNRLRRLPKQLPTIRADGSAHADGNDDEPGTRSGERRKP